MTVSVTRRSQRRRRSLSAGRRGRQEDVKPDPVVLSDEERSVLTGWVRRRKTSQALALRARIVPLGEGLPQMPDRAAGRVQLFQVFQQVMGGSGECSTRRSRAAAASPATRPYWRTRP